MPVIKVASYNIRRAIGMNDKKELQAVYRVLKEMGPDIIALQEVEMQPGKGVNRQAQELASLLEMNYVYQPVHRLTFGSVGNAVLSRFPFLNHTAYKLPDTRDERGCLQADIDIEGAPLSVFNMHLGLNQVSRYRHLKYIILPILQAVTNPAVLLGDLNATPRMREIRMLSGFIHDTFQHNAGLIGNTFPADAPRVRIDYIFTNSQCQCLSFRIIKSTASDHLPVMAAIKTIAETL